MRLSDPFAIDLYCGLGGWTEGLLAEEWSVVGFDIERHQYGDKKYPAQLVLQDVLTTHGAQFSDADLIVASPPCQFFSRMAMPFSCPWSPEEFSRRRDLALSLFWSCFRIQAEACEAAGRYVPLVVENVSGAQRWVGDARWHFGSYYLWGDIPALMPHVNKRDGYGHTRHLTNQRESDAVKIPGQDWSRFKKTGDVSPWWRNEATKNGGDWFSSGEGMSLRRRQSSRSTARKAASAEIAKIPFPLAQHIARCFREERGAGKETVGFRSAAFSPSAVVQCP